MSHGPTTPDALYGLMAEFDNPTDLVEAANRARLEGYTAMDAYSPYPIEELNDALGRFSARRWRRLSGCSR